MESLRVLGFRGLGFGGFGVWRCRIWSLGFGLRVQAVGFDILGERCWKNFFGSG